MFSNQEDIVNLDSSVSELFVAWLESFYFMETSFSIKQVHFHLRKTKISLFNIEH